MDVQGNWLAPDENGRQVPTMQNMPVEDPTGGQDNGGQSKCKKKGSQAQEQQNQKQGSPPEKDCCSRPKPSPFTCPPDCCTTKPFMRTPGYTQQQSDQIVCECVKNMNLIYGQAQTAQQQQLESNYFCTLQTRDICPPPPPPRLPSELCWEIREQLPNEWSTAIPQPVTEVTVVPKGTPLNQCEWQECLCLMGYDDQTSPQMACQPNPEGLFPTTLPLGPGKGYSSVCVPPIPDSPWPICEPRCKPVSDYASECASIRTIRGDECFLCALGPLCYYGNPRCIPVGTNCIGWRGFRWHEECFRCAHCNNCIGYQPFIPRGRAVYHPACYTETFNEISSAEWNWHINPPEEAKGGFLVHGQYESVDAEPHLAEVPATGKSAFSGFLGRWIRPTCDCKCPCPKNPQLCRRSCPCDPISPTNASQGATMATSPSQQATPMAQQATPMAQQATPMAQQATPFVQQNATLAQQITTLPQRLGGGTDSETILNETEETEKDQPSDEDTSSKDTNHSSTTSEISEQDSSYRQGGDDDEECDDGSGGGSGNGNGKNGNGKNGNGSGKNGNGKNGNGKQWRKETSCEKLAREDKERARKRKKCEKREEEARRKSDEAFRRKKKKRTEEIKREEDWNQRRREKRENDDKAREERKERRKKDNERKKEAEENADRQVKSNEEKKKQKDKDEREAQQRRRDEDRQRDRERKKDELEREKEKTKREDEDNKKREEEDKKRQEQEHRRREDDQKRQDRDREDQRKRDKEREEQQTMRRSQQRQPPQQQQQQPQTASKR